MEYRKIGNLDLSLISMGTYKSFNVRSEDDISVRKEIIDNCIRSGVTLIDSSPMYGESERVIGLTTDGPGVRGKLQLATKVWTSGRAEGERQIARSFELMRTDHIEVFQVHNLVDWETHLPTLEGLRADGRIDRPVATDALLMLAVDEYGLDEMDARVLKTLIEKFEGGPVGLNSLAVAMGEDATTLEEVYEPFLIMEGFLMRTPQGRVATPRAFQRFGYTIPRERGGDQGSLFVEG